MLARSSYSAAQIAAARAAFADLVDAWTEIAARSAQSARERAERQVFAQMVVALDGWFAHRLRAAEGKDGNALNEVRLLAQGITANGGYFPSDATIRWRPDASVTGFRAGDRIEMSAESFSRLSGAFLAGIAARFPEQG
jgi:hypothetical protein